MDIFLFVSYKINVILITVYEGYSWKLTSNDPTSPFSPFGPLSPFSPLDPGSPFLPAGPLFPGKPCIPSQ